MDKRGSGGRKASSMVNLSPQMGSRFGRTMERKACRGKGDFGAKVLAAFNAGCKEGSVETEPKGQGCPQPPSMP